MTSPEQIAVGVEELLRQGKRLGLIPTYRMGTITASPTNVTKGTFAMVTLDNDSQPSRAFSLVGSGIPIGSRVMTLNIKPQGLYVIGIAENATSANWTSWAPVWNATGTAPVLGNGSLIGNYKKFGRDVNIILRLIAGSTTTFGTGQWNFSLPFQPQLGTDMFPASCFDTSATQMYPAVARADSSNLFNIGAHTAAGAVGSVQNTHPFTWANGDAFMIKGNYQTIT